MRAKANTFTSTSIDYGKRIEELIPGARVTQSKPAPRKQRATAPVISLAQYKPGFNNMERIETMFRTSTMPTTAATLPSALESEARPTTSSSPSHLQLSPHPAPNSVSDDVSQTSAPSSVPSNGLPRERRRPKFANMASAVSSHLGLKKVEVRLVS